MAQRGANYASSRHLAVVTDFVPLWANGTTTCCGGLKFVLAYVVLTYRYTGELPGLGGSTQRPRKAIQSTRRIRPHHQQRLPNVTAFVRYFRRPIWPRR